MTQKEITDKLNRVKFVGLWPTLRLAKEAGLAHETIRKALAGTMSAKTQTRLEMLLKVLPEKYHRPAPKRKPGHKKRFFIRYMNLRKWVQTIEEHSGRNSKFRIRKSYDMSDTNRAGYICAKFDYFLKWYMLREYGDELKKKKIYLGDCYPAEQWIKRIQTALPHFKRELTNKLISRRVK